MTARMTSTVTPRLMNPCPSGGLSWMRAVLIRMAPSLIILSSMSEERGMWSVLPEEKGPDSPGDTKNECMRNRAPASPPKSA